MAFSGRQAAVLLALHGLTGLNSPVAFRTPMAQPLTLPNPDGARLAGRGE
jgi:hypothetical protein